MVAETAVTGIWGLLGLMVVAVAAPWIKSAMDNKKDMAARHEEAEIRRQEKAAEREQARLDKEQDWARLDEVAKRAEKVATKASETADLLVIRQDAAEIERAETAALLLAEQKQTNEKTDEVARVQAESTSALDLKLIDLKVTADQTHILVNSNMTAQMEDALHSAEAELVALEEVVDLKRAAGTNPSPSSIAVIEALKIRISKKRAELKDRLTANNRAEKSKVSAAETDEETKVK